MFGRISVAAAMLGVGVLGSPVAGAATQDGIVDQSGLSHSAWRQVRPRVIEQGEPFAVRFQALRGDLTGASVGIDDGSLTWYPASVVGRDGPYDIWSASVPAQSSDSFEYLIAVEDGGDTDYLTPAGVSEGFPSGGGWLVDFVAMSHAPLGATAVDGGTHFRVWAPGADEAWVGGDFNGFAFDTPMERRGQYWYAFVAGDNTGTGYKYSFDGVSWKPDPQATWLNEFQQYESLIYDTGAFVWTSDDFVAPPVEEWVVYQLHVGTFAGRNDPFGGAATPSRFVDVGLRADHLVELGVNCVYLNPVNEFPGAFSGGYNPNSLFALESKYGTPDQFKFMVNELHERGIAVIVDTVWNHMDSFNNFLWFYDGTQIYYDTPLVDTPWGPQLDFDRPQVRDHIVDSAEWLMGEFRVDGFRADAVFEIYGANQPVPGQEILRRINDLQDRSFRDGFVVAEDYSDDPWVTRSTGAGGLGFDAQYSNNWKEAIRSAVFESAFGNANIAWLADAIDGQGDVAGTRAFHYFELHDDAWPLNGRQRAVRTIDTSFPHDDDFARDRTILGNGLTILSRGVPAILQGTEWLEDEGWEENKIDWSHKTQYRGVFDLYADLIGMRTSEPALFANSFLSVIQANDGGDVLVFERSGSDGANFVIAANFSNTAYGSYNIGAPRSTAYEVVLNSEDAAYDGSGAGTYGTVTPTGGPLDGRPQSMTVSLPPRNLLILRTGPQVQPDCPTDFDGSGATDLNDLLAVLSAFGSDDGGDTDGDGVTDLNDLLAVLSAFGSDCD